MCSTLTDYQHIVSQFGDTSSNPHGGSFAGMIIDGSQNNKAITNIVAIPLIIVAQAPQHKRVFTKLNGSYLSIMQWLLKDNLITIPEIKSLSDNRPYPRWYDGSNFFHYHRVLGHDTEQCYRLQHVFQDHINSGAIKVDARKHKSNKSIDKTNRDLQIYINPFPLHSENFISTSKPSLDDGPYVNKVTITPIIPPPTQKGKVSDMSLSFTPLDAPYYGEPAPLYIPTKMNSQTVIGVMVDPSSRVNVIIEETLFVNDWHRPMYDECHTTLRMHDGFSIHPLGSITLTILVGPKVVSSMFIINS